MRTTITLDDDIVAAVEQLRRDQGLQVSAAVNELARRGLAAAPQQSMRRFKQRTARIGLRVDVTNIGDVLDALDS
jgi:hypothetical protein